MKTLVSFLVVVFAAGVYSQCSCPTMKWSTCDGPPCQCTLPVDDGTLVPLNCSTLIPKCILMKAEMYRSRKGQSTRSGGKPTEHALVDNDGIYDPDCETNGRFKAKQCNNTDVCWCVNSAGVRRTDKGPKETIKCEKLVETYWVRLELKHAPTAVDLDSTQLQTAVMQALQQRYDAKNITAESQYDPSARLIVLDVQKPFGDRSVDLARAAYYMEKDVKVLPLFTNQAKFQPMVNGQNVTFETIKVYYVDEERPTITMQRLTGGVIAVIVVVLLAVIAGLLVLFLARRKQKARYEKTQPREMDEMQQTLS